jgi:hypothetical protein
MISTLPLSPPVMKVAQFLDCNEQLIMSFLEANGAPFKWLFSESWNFYYRSLDSFASSPSLKPRRSNLEAYHQSDLWQNLERFFQVKTIRYKDVPLKPLVRDVVERGTCLYTMARMRFLPWHGLYGSESFGTHFFVINGIDEDKNQFHIVDWSPHHVGWVDAGTIEEGYVYRGFCYELSVPVIPVLDEALLVSQLRSCLSNMRGEVREEYTSGLKGLERMYEDIQGMTPDIDFLVSVWDLMKDVVETREGFTEFIHSIKDEENFSHILDSRFCDTLYETINMWYSFRNGAMKAKMTGRTDITPHLRKLASIIELERECERQLARVLEDSLSVSGKNGN